MEKEEKRFLRLSELAKITGLRKSTINFWTKLGLLPFKQDGFRLMRKFPEKETLRRIELIFELRNSLGWRLSLLKKEIEKIIEEDKYWENIKIKGLGPPKYIKIEDVFKKEKSDNDKD